MCLSYTTIFVFSSVVGFDSIYEIRYDEEAWKEFDRFLASYEKEKQKVDIESKRAEDELDRLASNTRSKLKSGVINYFNNKLNILLKINSFNLK